MKGKRKESEDRVGGRKERGEEERKKEMMKINTRNKGNEKMKSEEEKKNKAMRN